MYIDLCDPNQVQSWNFPGGEVGIKLSVAIQSSLYSLQNAAVTIKTRIQSSDDLIKLFMATDAIKRLPHDSISLMILYFPYARQDRVCCPGESLSIKVIADLINAQNYKTVTILDPHSDVTPALINNVRILSSKDFAYKVKQQSYFEVELNRPGYVLICPDAGAQKRTEHIAKALGYKDEIVSFKKVRNLETGEITGIDCDYKNFKGKRCIIFDDICDGGRTFIEIAKFLKSWEADKVVLAVTHGIFSKGFECLYEHLDYIYTTNSFRDILWTEQNLYSIKLQNLYSNNLCVLDVYN